MPVDPSCAEGPCLALMGLLSDANDVSNGLLRASVARVAHCSVGGSVTERCPIRALGSLLALPADAAGTDHPTAVDGSTERYRARGGLRFDDDIAAVAKLDGEAVRILLAALVVRCLAELVDQLHGQDAGVVHAANR